jgi:hypothetical protein
MSDDARTLVAEETGVPVDLLTGDDEDALREQATALLAYRDSAPPRPRGPRADPSQGATGRPVPFTAAEIARAEYERRHGPRADG